mgnify:CR=1 FL=1
MGEIQFRTIARYEYQAERNHGRFDIIYQCAARRPKTFPRFYYVFFGEFSFAKIAGIFLILAGIAWKERQSGAERQGVKEYAVLPALIHLYDGMPVRGVCPLQKGNVYAVFPQFFPAGEIPELRNTADTGQPRGVLRPW